MKTYLLLVFWTLFALPLTAQLIPDPYLLKEGHQGLDLIYEMKFDAAEAHLAGLARAYPEHPGPPFLRALNRWWQTYISMSTRAYYDFIEGQLDESMSRNEALEEAPGRHKEYVFFQFMAHALEARLFAYRGEWFSAVNAARKLVSPMKASLKYVGTEPEFYMLAGLYHYYVASYHEFYPVIRPFLSFFPDGDKEKGLAEMVQAANTTSIAQVEAGFFLGTIYLDEIGQPGKGLKQTQFLATRYPSNTKFELEYARALVKAGKYAQGEARLQAMRDRYISQPGFGTRNINSLESTTTSHLMIQVYHYLARVRLYGQQDFEGARFFLDQSDHMAKLAAVDESIYLTGNVYLRGLIADEQGEREAARKAYRRVLDMEANETYKTLAKAGLSRPLTLAD
ncbi:MAG: hypothetical protein D6722_03860 [Bacteroidetes bacterium]|nr:MAG: hypothetical protein D6722_03860 [Bacteroidota bacterium]